MIPHQVLINAMKKNNAVSGDREWQKLLFYTKWCDKSLSRETCMLSHFGHVQLFVTPWAVACQALLSKELSRQEHWSGLPWLPPGYLPDPGIKPMFPVLQADSLLLSHQGSPRDMNKVKEMAQKSLEKELPGRRERKHKGSQMVMHLSDLRNSRANVSGEEGVKERKGGNQVKMGARGEMIHGLLGLGRNAGSYSDRWKAIEDVGVRGTYIYDI